MALTLTRLGRNWWRSCVGIRRGRRAEANHAPRPPGTRNRRPGLATTRTGFWGASCPTDPCQRGVAPLKLKVTRLAISEVARPDEGLATGRDFANTRSGAFILARPIRYV